MGRKSLAIASCVAVLAGCVSVVARAQQVTSVIVPTDQLTVTVFGEVTLSGKFAVDVDGTFEFPLLGRIPAGGKNAREVEIDLTKRLADGFLKNPQVTVDIGQTATQRVFVMGEVRAPGAFLMAGEVTLIEALSRAGSTTASAAHDVLILRPRTQQAGPAENLDPAVPGKKEDDTDVIRVDLRELQAGGLRNNVALRDGDTVFVPKAQFVYITGQVRSPGAYTIEPGTTVLQALSLAGGVTDRGAASRIKITRTTNSKTQDISARPTDLVEPGDTIVVPERFF